MPSRHPDRSPPAGFNSHVHLPPNFSAFGSAAQAARLAGEQGVKVLGPSNYYDYSVYSSFADHALERAVFPLFGMEVICLDAELQDASIRVNDPANPGKIYLCGKAITRFAPMNAAAAELMGSVRRGDSARTADIIERLNRVFSAAGAPLDLTPSRTVRMVADHYGVAESSVYLQERHVAWAFQEALFSLGRGTDLNEVLAVTLGSGALSPGAGGRPAAQEVQDALRARLMKRGQPAYAPETFPSFHDAYRLVLELGGIPCYPVLADGATPICEYEQSPADLARSLARRRIYCAEVIPNRNRSDVVAEYVRTLRASGVPVLAGTEHNTLEMVPLSLHCAGGVPLPEDVREVLWEGVCVAAAHQYLLANEEPGYVDARGGLAEGYPDADARIEHFATLGASVMDEFYRTAVPA